MNIGIIGSGMIGGTFGHHMAKAGHQVLFSSRHPEQLKELASKAGPNASTGTVEDAARFGEVVLLSVPYKAIPEVAEKAGTWLSGKTIIDTCNPYPDRDGEIAVKVREDPERRESQVTLDLFPQANVVKALNTIWHKHLLEFAFREDGDRYALPLAGDDTASKETVQQLISDMGFDPVDVGSIRDSKIMEVDQPLYNKPVSAQKMKELLYEIRTS